MGLTVLIGFDDAQLLDLTGPAEVFARAFELRSGPRNRVVIASVCGGLITTSSGVRLDTTRLEDISPEDVDTVLVAGGNDGVRRAARDERLLGWLRRAADHARRYGSVCSGTFVVAAAGLAEGRRVATHWIVTDLLARAFPSVTVDPDAIYVVDGPVWTSAGVTTGIDMALAMVEADYGRDLADAIAQRLVLYARRPGTQAQISDVLKAQAMAEDRLAEVLRWAHAHPDESLTVERMAERAGMTLRTFHRRCITATGLTPAKLIEKLRVEAARPLLAEGVPAKVVAARTGFRDPGRMARAFDRVLGMRPRAYKQLFGRQMAGNGTMRESRP